MSRLVFHVGHSKTGTTALQTTLAANLDRLRAAGVLYPIRTRPTSHEHKHALAKPYLTGRDNFSLRRSTGLRDDELWAMSETYWRGVRDEVASTPHDLVVLSCEGFWAPPRRQEPGFRARLADVCDHVTIAAYLRSPARFFLSQLNQNVRMLRGVSLSKAERFRPVIEAFRLEGFEDMSLRLFEPARLVGGDVVEDFQARYLPAGLGPLRRQEGERGNESVSNEALAVLDDAIHEHGRPDPESKDRRRNRLVTLVREADAAVGGNRRPSLRPGIAEALARRSTDLAWLRDETGLAFEDVDYAIAGQEGGPSLEGLERVADFSPLDPDRLAELRRLTSREIARIFAAGPDRGPAGRPEGDEGRARRRGEGRGGVAGREGRRPRGGGRVGGDGRRRGRTGGDAP